ncbi:hypothetical protein GCM10022251_31340 [Phytohabitans flavus]|uniref:Uncharacterized protein n=1 Tax=Phytohabitans flavus TaxID=1076124 RepID=A0A6F8XX10_9ACTN|nr:hypothetical protein Pflav_046810 [Phytohabitans flavus]
MTMPRRTALGGVRARTPQAGNHADIMSPAIGDCPRGSESRSEIAADALQPAQISLDARTDRGEHPDGCYGRRVSPVPPL